MVSTSVDGTFPEGVRCCFRRMRAVYVDIPGGTGMPRESIANCCMCGIGILGGEMIFHSHCCPYGCEEDLGIPLRAYVCCECFCTHPRIRFSYDLLYSHPGDIMLRLGFVYKPVGTNTKSARK